VAEPTNGVEIRALRERGRLSQAAFARYLNLTVGYISQLERGVKQPKGPALALLNVIRRKGLGVMLWGRLSPTQSNCWRIRCGQTGCSDKTHVPNAGHGAPVSAAKFRFGPPA
jgi:transcriptional regulator with XRE-family HTH domain